MNLGDKLKTQCCGMLENTYIFRQHAKQAMDFELEAWIYLAPPWRNLLFYDDHPLFRGRFFKAYGKHPHPARGFILTFSVYKTLFPLLAFDLCRGT